VRDRKAFESTEAALRAGFIVETGGFAFVAIGAFAQDNAAGCLVAFGLALGCWMLSTTESDE